MWRNLGLLSGCIVGSTACAYSCGIIGFVGVKGKDDAKGYLIEGITIMQNRGYDSAGIATLDEHKNTIEISKFASVGTTSDCIDTLKEHVKRGHMGHSVGIGHTRWATHGAKTDYNAHPHSDYKQRIALVHNGTLENYTELKEMLKKKGIEFKTETDTEVIANMIGSFLDEGIPIQDAIKNSVKVLRGTWGLAIISKDRPKDIFVSCNGSPLLVGLDQDNKRMFVSSEHSAFSNHTSSYIVLKDSEMVVINADNFTLDMSRIEQAPKDNVLLSPTPFDHWTIREIHEQPEAISRALNYGGRLDSVGNVRLGGLDGNQERLLSIENLLISACGTSLFAANYGSQLMGYLESFKTVEVIDAAEVNQDSFSKNCGILAISQSGETKDVHRTVDMTLQLGIPCFSVINSVGSLIARTTKCGVYLNAGREQAVASTKAFVTQVTVLSLIAVWFAQKRNNSNSPRTKRLLTALHRLPTYAGMTLRKDEQVKKIAKTLVDSDSIFVLGSRFGESIAHEGALKIKEITYIHAEGMEAGSFNHGPAAVLQKGTPVVLLVFNDSDFEHMKKTSMLVKEKGGKTIVITDIPNKVKNFADEIIEIPSNGPLTALLATIPLQLLAYYISVMKGIDPDKPKNLAKAVTVD